MTIFEFVPGLWVQHTIGTRSYEANRKNSSPFFTGIQQTAWMEVVYYDSFDLVWSDAFDGYAEFEMMENKSLTRRFQRTMVNKMLTCWEKYSGEHVGWQFDSDWRRSNQDF